MGRVTDPAEEARTLLAAIRGVCETYTPEDAALIAAAPDLLTALTHEVERLRRDHQAAVRAGDWARAEATEAKGELAVLRYEADRA